jgi:hypothetical protein
MANVIELRKTPSPPSLRLAGERADQRSAVGVSRPATR